MCDCEMLSAIRKRTRFHEEQIHKFKRMLLVYYDNEKKILGY
jgi:hypothetical protein